MQDRYTSTARWRHVRIALLAFAATGCESEATSRLRVGRLLYAGTDSMGVVPGEAAAIRVRVRGELEENSAAAMSVVDPGILFTINDSGHEPVLFAVDTTGSDRGAWHVAGATNADWEAASIGPCAVRDSAGPAERGPPRCIYIGDVGDNAAARSSTVIYRVREPAPQRRRFTGTLPADALRYVYEDGPHDVEAMYVGPDGDIALITKRPLRDPAGRLRPALVFTIPAAAWARDTIAVAKLTDSIAIVPGSAPFRTITDAALSPDARYVAVRTYAQVYVFAADSATGRMRAEIPPAVCNIMGLGERQGEGVAWYGATRKLLLTSEGNNSPMHVIGCPLPR